MAKVRTRPNAGSGAVAAVHETALFTPGHSARLGTAAPRAAHDEAAASAVGAAAAEAVCKHSSLRLRWNVNHEAM